MKRAVFVAAAGIVLAGLALRRLPEAPYPEEYRELEALLLESNPEDAPIVAAPPARVCYTYTDEALAAAFPPSRPRWLSRARRMIGIADADDNRWFGVELIEELYPESKK